MHKKDNMCSKEKHCIRVEASLHFPSSGHTSLIIVGTILRKLLKAVPFRI